MLPLNSATPSDCANAAAHTNDSATVIRAIFMGIPLPKTRNLRTIGATIFILLLRGRTPGQKICEHPVGARHAGGKLTEEGETRIDVVPLAHLRDEERALQLGLAGIGHREKRRISGRPGMRKVEAALLNPSFPVRWADAVGSREDRVVGIEDLEGSRLVGDPVARDCELFGDESLVVDHRLLVLHDQESARTDIVEK